MVLTFCGALLAFTLVPGKKVIRADGTKVILMKNPSWKTEILGLWETFFTDPYILLLFPMFFTSNWFYTYHFNDVNAAKFNTRTRALNSVLYWLAQIVGAAIFGFLLDMGWGKIRIEEQPNLSSRFKEVKYLYWHRAGDPMPEQEWEMARQKWRLFRPVRKRTFYIKL